MENFNVYALLQTKSTVFLIAFVVSKAKRYSLACASARFLQSSWCESQSTLTMHLEMLKLYFYI